MPGILVVFFLKKIPGLSNRSEPDYEHQANHKAIESESLLVNRQFSAKPL